MRIRKAVITAAGKNQRTLPLQTLIDRDGTEKQVLRIILDEVLTANIEEICIVVSPDDEAAYLRAAGDRAERHTIRASDRAARVRTCVCIARKISSKTTPSCIWSGITCTSAPPVRVARNTWCGSRKRRNAPCPPFSLFPKVFCTTTARWAGSAFPEAPDLYRVENVIEKPTPTEAEQKLNVAGMRVGHYLCFFGMHVLTPAVMQILEKELQTRRGVTLSERPGAIGPRGKISRAG